MEENSEHFNNSGLSLLNHILKTTNPELHPVYLSYVVDLLGKNKYQLPTQKNENALLQKIKSAEGINISTETLIRTQRILTLTRKRRMEETSLFLIQKQQMSTINR